jgi:hypothetical protein
MGGEPVMLQRGLRALAVAIAVAALLDPSLARPRAALREVAVVAPQVSDSSLRARVVAALPAPITVTASAGTGTDATVLIGAQRLGEATVAGRLLLLTPPARAPSVAFEQVTAPPLLSAQTALAVRVRVHARQVTDQRLTLRLHAGPLTLQSLDLVLPAASAVIDTVLTALPDTAGPWALRVSASVADGAAVAHWDLLTQVRDAPWRVLVYDARASWSSTFVRRALEADPRFVVTHRVLTAPGVSRAAGAAPTVLSAASALAQTDVLIVGAPDALDAAATRSVERHASRGGAVVLLVDSLGGTALRTLSGVGTWRESRGVRSATDQRGLRLTAGRWFTPSTPLALLVQDSVGGGVYRADVGRGSVWISGAADAWQFRDAARSDFALLWPQLIEDAALGTVPALVAELDQGVVAPGDSLWLSLLTDEGDAITLTLGDATRALGTGPAYRRVGWTAPNAVGDYTLTVRRGQDTVTLPLLVRTDARQDALPATALLAAWAAATGGGTLPSDSLTVIGARLDALAPAATAARWHPMREPWWLLIFAAALSAEWYLRRRRGLA